MKKLKNSKGFTLMEMLIVVAIIAVLIAIAIPTFTNQLEKAREATDLANLRGAYAQVMAAALTNAESDTTIGLVRDGADGLIPHLKPLTLAGKVAVYGRGGLVKARGKRGAIADELRRRAAHPVREFIQRVNERRLIPPVLQYPRFVLIELVELREKLRVPRAYLAYGVVE